MKNIKHSPPRDGLPRCPTGIKGLDEVTHGGIPRGRPTLVCGGAGCGKTLLATEFLVRGALDHGEPGVFMSFEEKAEDLALNVRSLGFDLPKLIRDKRKVMYYSTDEGRLVTISVAQITTFKKANASRAA